MTLSEARELLQVSKPKMIRMVKQFDFKLYQDARDNRRKLVKRSDIQALLVPKPR